MVTQTWNIEGPIPSESFTMEGSTNGTTPELAGILLLGSGFCVIAGWLQRKIS